MTLAELARRISYAEYVEWQCFDSLEPFGDLRGDWQAARIAHAALRPHVKGELRLVDMLPFDAGRFDPEPDEDALWDSLERAQDRAAREIGMEEG